MIYKAIVLAAVTAAMLAGCTPNYGVVSATSGLEVGNQAPDIQYTTIKGKKVDFNKVRYSTAVLAFIEVPGSNCCWLSPDVVKIANEVFDLPVTVVQVTLPTSPCPHGEGCVEVCKIRNRGLISMCDSSRIAWKAFGQPKGNTVILIDKSGKVIQTAPLASSGALVAKAAEMGQAFKDKETNEDEMRVKLYTE
jgi:hypothetical protein